MRVGVCARMSARQDAVSSGGTMCVCVCVCACLCVWVRVFLWHIVYRGLDLCGRLIGPSHAMDGLRALVYGVYDAMGAMSQFRSR